MYKLELSLDVYQRLEKCLSEIHPEINLILVSCDYALANLGFVESPPCVIHADLTHDERRNLLDELMDIESASVDMPCRSKEYQLYIKCGWMWDVFYSAEYIEP